jgi:hypothetical protein
MVSMAFPGNMSNEDIIREFETNDLVRPYFSMWATAKPHQLTSLGGVTRAVSGLFGCARISWKRPREVGRSQPRPAVLSPNIRLRNASKKISGDRRLIGQMGRQEYLRGVEVT